MVLTVIDYVYSDREKWAARGTSRLLHNALNAVAKQTKSRLNIKQPGVVPTSSSGGGPPPIHRLVQDVYIDYAMSDAGMGWIGTSVEWQTVSGIIPCVRNIAQGCRLQIARW